MAPQKYELRTQRDPTLHPYFAEVKEPDDTGCRRSSVRTLRVRARDQASLLQKTMLPPKVELLHALGSGLRLGLPLGYPTNLHTCAWRCGQECS